MNLKRELKLWLELGVELRCTRTCAAHKHVAGSCCVFDITEGHRCVKNVPRDSVLRYPVQHFSTTSMDDPEKFAWHLCLADNESVHIDYRRGSDVYDLAILDALGELSAGILLHPTGEAVTTRDTFVFRPADVEAGVPYRVLQEFQTRGSDDLQDFVFTTNESLYTERAWAGLCEREFALGAQLGKNELQNHDEIIARRTFRMDLHDYS